MSLCYSVEELPSNGMTNQSKVLFVSVIIIIVALTVTVIGVWYKKIRSELNTFPIDLHTYH